MSVILRLLLLIQILLPQQAEHGNRIQLNMQNSREQSVPGISDPSFLQKGI
jgi:hypothetical protein